MAPQTNARLTFLLVLAGLVLVALSVVYELVLLGNFGSDDGGAAKTNCPSCGARVPADREHCEHCSDPLPTRRGAAT